MTNNVPWVVALCTMSNEKMPFLCDRYQWLTWTFETEREDQFNKVSRRNITLRN